MISELVQDLWKMFKNQKNSLFKGGSSCNVCCVTGPSSFDKLPRGARSPGKAPTPGFPGGRAQRGDAAVQSSIIQWKNTM